MVWWGCPTAPGGVARRGPKLRSLRSHSLAGPTLELMKAARGLLGGPALRTLRVTLPSDQAPAPGWCRAEIFRTPSVGFKLLFSGVCGWCPPGGEGGLAGVDLNPANLEL